MFMRCAVCIRAERERARERGRLFGWGKARSANSALNDRMVGRWWLKLFNPIPNIISTYSLPSKPPSPSLTSQLPKSSKMASRTALSRLLTTARPSSSSSTTSSLSLLTGKNALLSTPVAKVARSATSASVLGAVNGRRYASAESGQQTMVSFIVQIV